MNVWSEGRDWPTVEVLPETMSFEVLEGTTLRFSIYFFDDVRRPIEGAFEFISEGGSASDDDFVRSWGSFDVDYGTWPRSSGSGGAITAIDDGVIEGPETLFLKLNLLNGAFFDDGSISKRFEFTIVEEIIPETLGRSIIGNKANEHIFGEPGDDMIAGRGGDDRIFGYNGDDIIKGGGGNDYIGAGEGKNVAYGGNGADVIGGGSDRDKIFGNTGQDNLSGYGGRDKLFGGSGDDNISGGDGRDRLIGQKGNDELNGGEGSDYLTGGKGNDNLIGGEGADVFVFSSGQDLVRDFDHVVHSDAIDLRFASGVRSFKDLKENHIEDTAVGLVISDKDGNSLRLAGISSSDVTREDFLFS